MKLTVKQALLVIGCVFGLDEIEQAEIQNSRLTINADPNQSEGVVCVNMFSFEPYSTHSSNGGGFAASIRSFTFSYHVGNGGWLYSDMYQSHSNTPDGISDEVFTTGLPSKFIEYALEQTAWDDTDTAEEMVNDAEANRSLEFWYWLVSLDTDGRLRAIADRVLG